MPRKGDLNIKTKKEIQKKPTRRGTIFHQIFHFNDTNILVLGGIQQQSTTTERKSKRLAGKERYSQIREFKCKGKYSN